ncbi:MAG: EamA family transporter [Anaerolineales bacterium]
MTLSNFLLILGSACIHVVAHVGLKRTQDRTAFVWWLLLWGCVLFAPVLVWGWQAIPSLGWGLMFLSAIFEAGYFAAIAQAYQDGDLSIIYPLARGTAPLLTLVWATLFLHETYRPGGVVGIALIAVGLYVINLPRLGAWLEPLRALNQPGPRWALLAGLCISGYTVIDRKGIEYAPPLLYTYLALWITLGLLTPFTLRRVGGEGLKRELHYSRLSSVVAGFTTLAAYAIVLYAMRAGTPASYAGAVREVSVVLGTGIGIFALKEKGTAMRLVGAALVAGGAILIKLLG